MTMSMYDVSIPSFERALGSLAAILDKGADYAAAKKFDSAVLVQVRLAPDMLPLVAQVQIACDIVKGAAARLAGIEIPKYEDKEASFEDLNARVKKTRDFVAGVTAAQLKGAEVREIVLETRTNTLKFTGLTYLTHFVLPNLYFHVGMTYALLRHNGVELGKKDFLGAIQ
jgi:hypothetical protein